MTTLSRRRTAANLTLGALAITLAAAVAPFAAAQKPQDEFPATYYYESPTSPTRNAHRSLEGQAPPPISISQWIGDPVDLSSLKGKVVVVDFWATWCPPCMASLPHNVELANRYERQGLVFLGIHDSQRGWDRAPQTITKRQIKYPVGKDDGGKSTRAWKLGFWPTYGVIDRKGKLRALGIKPDAVEPVVKKLLAEAGDTRERPDTGKQAKKPAPPPVRWLEGTASARQRLERVLDDETAPPLEGSKWLNVPEAATAKGLKLEEFRGKVVLLDFCLPTRDTSTNQMVRNNQLYNQNKEAGLVVIGICRPDGADQIAEVVSKLGIEYPVFVDDGKATTNAYGADGAPDTYLIDRAGRLRVADCKENSVEDAIALLLKEEVPSSPTQAKKSK